MKQDADKEDPASLYIVLQHLTNIAFAACIRYSLVLSSNEALGFIAVVFISIIFENEVYSSVSKSTY